MRAYFDIDGVFNAFKSMTEPQEPQCEATGWHGKWGNGKVHRDHFETLPEEWGEWFHLCWSTELVDSLNELAATPGVELVWATTWRYLAPTIFSPLTGVNGADWRVLHAPWARIEQKSPWWKHELVMEDIASNPVDKFVWVDDDLIRNPEAVLWAESIPGSKVVIPTLNTGLTREQWNGITGHLGIEELIAA